MKQIFGVSHPIPTQFAERIYNESKTVFVGKTYLGKVSKGDKFVIYESQGAKAYTGWAEIEKIEKMAPNNILRKFKDKLMVNEAELSEYASGKEKMTIIEFKNFQKFDKPVKPKRFVPLRGKYIYDREYQMLKRNKD